MVYVIDHVLPTNYFANNLRALSVDMAVLRDLMRAKLVRLSKHLDSLQAQALSQNGSNAMYEPPLINVFTMQWFLTLFSTCLPEETVLRVWDSILLEGSEVLLRAAVAIWGKLGEYVSSPALFFCTVLTFRCSGRGGYSTNFETGGSASRSNPLPFYIPFFTKKLLLSYTFY